MLSSGKKKSFPRTGHRKRLLCDATCRWWWWRWTRQKVHHTSCCGFKVIINTRENLRKVENLFLALVWCLMLSCSCCCRCQIVVNEIESEQKSLQDDHLQVLLIYFYFLLVGPGGSGQAGAFYLPKRKANKLCSLSKLTQTTWRNCIQLEE